MRQTESYDTVATAHIIFSDVEAKINKKLIMSAVASVALNSINVGL